MSKFGLLAIGAALSQLILLALLLGKGREGNRTRWLFMVLLIATLCYLVLPLLDEWPMAWLVGAVTALIPGIFWLFCSSLFDDHFQIRWWHPSLIFISAVLPVLWQLAGSPLGVPQWLLVEVPQLMEYVFLLLALFAVFRNWKDDLLSTRRNLRIWFCGTTGIFILLLILAREVFFSGADWLLDIQYEATAVIMLGTNFILLRIAPGLLDPIQRTAAEVIAVPDEATPGAVDESLAPVIRLIEEEGIHREYGMTIGKLAALADVPEYRLRQMINSGMGFRNFNDFLNSFRIREASERLVNPKEVKLPVLTIALDVGFRSISSFNKAFKDFHGVTPTAYRRQHIPTDRR